MATTRQDIRDWLATAKRDGATHLIVACDTFDHEDYPVVVLPGENVNAVLAVMAEPAERQPRDDSL